MINRGDKPLDEEGIIMTMEELAEITCTTRELETVGPMTACLKGEGLDTFFSRYYDMLGEVNEAFSSTGACGLWMPDVGAFLGYYLVYGGQMLELDGGAEASGGELLEFLNSRLLALDPGGRQLSTLEVYGFLGEAGGEAPRVGGLWDLMRFLRNVNWLLQDCGFRTVLFNMGGGLYALCLCAKEDAVEVEAGGLVEDEFWKPIVPEDVKDEHFRKAEGMRIA